MEEVNPTLSCSFCESELLDVICDFDCGGMLHHYVMCLDCAACGPICDTREEACSKWDETHERHKVAVGGGE